ncbi:PLP-dependent aminotransferase family protein [Cupriavidus consociatus]|uniref:MocR-like pyridoxine biosynthesis transcription factor PdxR n=1 Tax=Cupriavidus consociatus TaxID=2821357 RepID=UPI001FD7FDBC|nr:MULTISPECIES: PLP-dependent aminotransferase family protein [unclassified Cupriavidus]MDK2661164.1 PLP-dependent aminotransferase family protein [Cupriavidus sp. LEh21]
MKETPLTDWLLARSHWSTPVRSGVPLNRQLFDDIRDAILAGQLSPGTRLPPTRELAQDLGIARNTVLYAYDRLTDEGYTQTHGGSGTYVGNTAPDPALLASMAGVDQQPPYPGDESRLSQRARELLAHVGVSDVQAGAFVPGIPDVSQFPRGVWQRLITKAWKFASQEQLGYGSRHGFPPLKRALTEYLALARGVDCSPEQIIVTQGSHQAIDLCARMLADHGDRIWVEDPCYWGARSIFRSAGLQMDSLPVDEQGIQPPVSPGEPPRLIFVTPSHQYPSGAVMSLARRRLLTELAHRHGAWIIEDDYDSEFRYQGAPLPSLQGLDPHHNTIYVGSFSKVLYPGLRLGFLIVPPGLADAFSVAQSELHRGGQLLIQAALAEFIADGHYAAHVRKMRKIYGERQALLTSELQHQLGEEIDIVGTDTGLHLTVKLRHAHDQLVSRCALAHGIVARPFSSYFASQQNSQNGLVLGYGGVSNEEIASSVAKLAHAIQLVREPGRDIS